MVYFKTTTRFAQNRGEGLQIWTKHAVLPDGSLQVVNEQGQVPFLSEGAPLYTVLRYEVEFDVADRYSISLFTALFDKFFNNAAKAQNFLEIQHRIGIV